MTESIQEGDGMPPLDPRKMVAKHARKAARQAAIDGVKDGTLKALQTVIYKIVYSFGIYGCIGEQICARFEEMGGNSVRSAPWSRVTVLQNWGLVYDTSTTRRAVGSGRQQTVYVASEFINENPVYLSYLMTQNVYGNIYPGMAKGSPHKHPIPKPAQDIIHWARHLRADTLTPEELMNQQRILFSALDGVKY